MAAITGLRNRSSGEFGADGDCLIIRIAGLAAEVRVAGKKVWTLPKNNCLYYRAP